MRHILLSAWCVVFFCTSEAQAQPIWQAEGSTYRVGLVVDGRNSEAAENFEAELASRLSEAGAALVRPSPVEIEDENGAGPMSELRDRGRQTYFFDGPESARRYLSEELATGLEITQPWMVNSLESEALFEAVLYLIRSHLDLEEGGAATAWMSRAVTAFPGHRPDERDFPPLVIELWQEEVHRQAGANALLDLSALTGRRECQVEINGAQVEVARIAVTPDRSYLVGYRCGEEELPTWLWARAGAERIRAVIPLDTDLDEGEAMVLLDEVATQSGFDAVVYVGRGDCGQGPSGICIAAGRMDGREDVLSLRPLGQNSTDEVWPVIRPIDGIEELFGQRSTSRATSIGLGATGIAILGAGAGWWFFNSSRELAFACSPTTSTSRPASDCEGVEVEYFIDDEARAEHARNLAWNRLGAGLTMGLGATLSLAGALGLIRHSGNFEVRAGLGGVALHLRY